MKRFRWIYHLLFGVFCFIILWYTIISRHPTRRTGIKLDLLWSYRKLFSGDPKGREYVKQNISNVALFFPFGFFFPGKRWWAALFFAAITSITIEVNQYVWKLGFCELDDLICNCIGSILGFCLYHKIESIL